MLRKTEAKIAQKNLGVQNIGQKFGLRGEGGVVAGHSRNQVIRQKVVSKEGTHFQKNPRLDSAEVSTNNNTNVFRVSRATHMRRDSVGDKNNFLRAEHQGDHISGVKKRPQTTGHSIISDISKFIKESRASIMQP